MNFNKFDELSILSKESFKNGLLDVEAEKWGKKAKKHLLDNNFLRISPKRQKTKS
jgi:hypothetical protein